MCRLEQASCRRIHRPAASHIDAVALQFDSTYSITAAASRPWRVSGREGSVIVQRVRLKRSPSIRPATEAGRFGFTLLEAMIAISILLVAVVAVSSAVTAGQQHAYEAQLRISGTIAAEELMGRLYTVEYDDLIKDWNGFEQSPGQMRTQHGRVYPAAFKHIGRRVAIEESIQSLTELNVHIHGLTIEVEAFDQHDRSLVTLKRFLPQPQHVTIPGIDDHDDLSSGGYVREVLDDAGTSLSDFTSLTTDALGGS